jgi:selenocysteine lyase/cysteine desulfurase
MHPAAVGQFAPMNGTYLDSATYGLPPASTVAALEDALHRWSTGTANWITDWDMAGDRCRPFAGQLIGAPAEEIALIPAVSVGVGQVVHQALPRGEILIADDEFTSVLLPILAAAERHGLAVRRAPFDRLPEMITDRTGLVATSHVRSNDGRMQDLAALMSAAAATGTEVLVDVTHSCGILPIEAAELGIDYVVCAAYKHLLCPRGVGFLRVAPRHWQHLLPVAASWRGAQAPYGSSFGGDLSALSPTASRYDISLAWHAWVGAEHSLAYLCSVPADERRCWCVGLATDLAATLCVPATGSSILTVPVTDAAEAHTRLAQEGIATAIRAGAIRISFHLYNAPEDVVQVAGVLEPFLRR